MHRLCYMHRALVAACSSTRMPTEALTQTDIELSEAHASAGM